MPDQLTASLFEDHLDETFVVRVDLIDPSYPALDLTLVSVSELGRPPAADENRRRPFALLFRGPAQPVLAQRTFQLDNDRLGALALFLVPVGPDGAAMQYEAVFA
ncbi:MAG: hypothetical protein R2844_21810 [Caldilineales bacterium]